MRSDDIERTNDEFVRHRHDWPPEQILAEYNRWSRRVATAATALARTPLNGVRVPLAELGRFPMGLLLCGAMLFDHHTHLRNDIAPALGRTVPETDPLRTAVVLEWMLAVLANQLKSGDAGAEPLAINLELTGPGGGAWCIQPSGAITPGPAQHAEVTIVGLAAEFPDWGTRRSNWRDRDVTITGNEEYAESFLDRINIV